MRELFNLHLPKENVDVTLKIQTPRILDNIVKKKNELLAKNSEMIDPTFVLTIMSGIDLVDGNKLNYAELERFVQNLSMKDTNLIIQRMDTINQGVGINTIITNHCDRCGYDYLSTFRITQEFFRPTED